MLFSPQRELLYRCGWNAFPMVLMSIHGSGIFLIQKQIGKPIPVGNHRGYPSIIPQIPHSHTSRGLSLP